MARGEARDFLNAIDGFPVLPPPFVITFLGPINRTRMPLPASWVAVYGVILPIFCRVALPNQAQWFVDLCWEGGTWCLGRGWESFSLHADFRLGDDLLFAYQSDGLFIVSRIENGSPLQIFNEPDIAIADVNGLDPLPDIQQLFAEWDAAAAALANAAHMQLPPGDIFDLVDGEQPPEDNEDNTEAHGGNVDPTLAESALVEVCLNLNTPPVVTEVGESSGAVLNLGLSLGSGPRRSAIYKTVGPVFVKKLEPTHINYGLTIPKYFWDTYIRQPHGTYDFKFHMGSFVYDVEVKFKRTRVRVGRGWDEFVQANKLEVGTILRLELFRPRKIHFVVTVR